MRKRYYEDVRFVTGIRKLFRFDEGVVREVETGKQVQARYVKVGKWKVALAAITLLLGNELDYLPQRVNYKDGNRDNHSLDNLYEVFDFKEFSQREVRAAFDYDSRTGVMKAKVNVSRTVLKGDVVGTGYRVANRNYLIVYLSHSKVFLHWIIAVYMFGNPQVRVRFEDKDPTNLRLNNLRFKYYE